MTPARAVVPLDLMSSSAGARAQALGEAGVALEQGIFAPFWNPAALDLVPASPAPDLVTLDSAAAKEFDFSLGSHYSKLYGEVDRFVLGVGLPFKGFSLALHYASETVGGIPLVSEDADGRPVLEGSFADSQTALAGTGALALLDGKLRLGCTLKLVQHGLYQQSSSGFGLDAGAIYKLNDKLNIGAVARNVLQPKMRWSSGHTDTFARKLLAGVSSCFDLGQQSFLALAQVGYEQGTGTLFGVGLEASLIQWLALRLGLDKQSLTAGLGFTFGQFGLDYAYRGHADLGASHQISLTVEF